jgi:dipeptidyl aminopeptidase/acylaminoacyl peptidase
MLLALIFAAYHGTSMSRHSCAFPGKFALTTLTLSFFLLPLLGATQEVTPTAAQPNRSKIGEVIEELRGVQRFNEVSVSPDGHWITWTQVSPANGGVDLYLFDHTKTGAKPHQVAVNGSGVWQDESGVVWARDSTRFAFLASVDSSEQRQIFVASAPTGKAHAISKLKGYITTLLWSPDDKQLAFLFAENGGGGGPLDAVPARTGVIGAEIHNQCIAVVSPEGGTVHRESPAHLNVYEYDWSPDGTRFTAIAAPGPADNNWWTAQLFVLDRSSGRMNPIYRPPADRQLAIPRWSPDSKQIAFIGGLMSDAGFVGGDIFIIDCGGGEARDVTRHSKNSPSWLAWQHDKALLFTASNDGGSLIGTLNLATNQSTTLWEGGEGLHDGGNDPNFSITPNGQLSVAIRSSWNQAPEVWAGPIGRWTQLTHANDNQQAHWGKAASIIWNNDGFRMQGWLLYPENYNPSHPYPMVVSVHGGPAGERSPAWPSTHFDVSVMAALGYFVFFPNPRGSYGEGEAFTRANAKDFGGGDLRDILTGVDAVLAKVSVDKDRVGITGWSYGGYMTMWTVTQTHRFRAAVAGAGIADWKSYYGENSIDQWMIPYFGNSVYNTPEVYARSSPIDFIKQVKTPTLVVVGERDGECPAPQSFEFWHALQTLDIPTRLVVYPGEGHSFRQPKDQLDVLQQALTWFDQYLKRSN